MVLILLISIVRKNFKLPIPPKFGSPVFRVLTHPRFHFNIYGWLHLKKHLCMVYPTSHLILHFLIFSNRFTFFVKLLSKLPMCKCPCFICLVVKAITQYSTVQPPSCPLVHSPPCLCARSSNSSLVLDKLYIVSAINKINCSHTLCCETDIRPSERAQDQSRSMHTANNIPANPT